MINIKFWKKQILRAVLSYITSISVSSTAVRIEVAHTQNFTETTVLMPAPSLAITSTNLLPAVNTLCYKGCESPGALTADIIEQSSTSSVKVYPNPFTDIVHITFNTHEGAYSLTVADMEGKELLHRQGETKEGINNLTVNLNHLSKGVYLLSIRTSNSLLIQKLVKP